MYQSTALGRGDLGWIYAARPGQSYGSCLGSRKGRRCVWGHRGRTDTSGMRPVPYCWITWYWCALCIRGKVLLFAGGVRLRGVQMARVLFRSWSWAPLHEISVGAAQGDLGGGGRGRAGCSSLLVLQHFLTSHTEARSSPFRAAALFAHNFALYSFPLPVTPLRPPVG